MKVYAKRYCAGYEKGDEVEVYDVYSGKYNGSILFLIWSPKLKKWAWVWADDFAPYPFWMEDDNGK